MTKLLLAAFAVFTLNITNAQIQMVETKPTQTIGEIKQFGVLVSNLSFTTDEDDTTYILTFKDVQYQQLKEYKTLAFLKTGDVLNDLYNVLIQAMDKEETNFKLGTHSISVRPMKQMGIKYITVLVDANGYFYLNEKQLNKLFNHHA